MKVLTVPAVGEPRQQRFCGQALSRKTSMYPSACFDKIFVETNFRDPLYNLPTQSTLIVLKSVCWLRQQLDK